jgi:geranylgeranyl reductase family protein
MPIEKYDVVVIGAGPGGSATAYYLARRGLRVLLLDKALFPRDKTCGDGLTPRALAVLDDMGLLERVARAGCRINGAEIYAPNGLSVSAPVSAHDPRYAYMLVVPRVKLDDILRQHALSAGATFEGRVHVTNVASTPDGVLVTAQRNGETLTFAGRAAVVSTGANMRLLLNMGLLQAPPPTMTAARAYYDNLNVLSDRIQLRFDGVPLPGYGWVFPTAPGQANVGAGYFAAERAATHRLPSPQEAFDAFVHRSHLSGVFGKARRLTPVKGFPLRIDFLSAPTFAGRTLLVGEAIGLVNPLSGEGIDYALESGRIAAEHLATMLAQDDFSEAQFQAYHRALHERFQKLFEFCFRMRKTLYHTLWLNILVSMATRRNDLKLLLVRIVLGDQPPPQSITLPKVIKALWLGIF